MRKSILGILILLLSCTESAIVDDPRDRRWVDEEFIPLNGLWNDREDKHSVIFFDSTYLYGCSRNDYQILPFKGYYHLRKKDTLLFISSSEVIISYKVWYYQDSMSFTLSGRPFITFYKQKDE